MNQEPITGEMLVAEVLAQVPNARAIFQKHGIDPVTSCGPTVHVLRLDDAPVHCRLENLEELLTELNQSLAQADGGA